MNAPVKFRMTPGQLRLAKWRAIGYTFLTAVWIGAVIWRPFWQHGWAAIFAWAAFGIYFSIAWSAWQNIILNVDRPVKPKGGRF